MSTQIGIIGSKFKCEPVDRIHRFAVYNRGKFDLLPIDEQVKNINYQINGGEGEQVVVRLWKNEQGFYKCRYFHSKGIDKELAGLLAREWVKRLQIQFKFSNEFELKEIDY